MAEKIARPLRDALLEKGQALFSGRIDVEIGGLTGALHLSEGQIVDAKLGSFTGEPALWRMLLPVAPRLHFEAGRPRATEGAVLGRPDSLLPRFDERLALLLRFAEKVGGFERVWAIRFDALAAQLEDLPDAVQPVIRLLDGKRSVRQVASECVLDDLLALRILGRLLSLGILVLPDNAFEAEREQAVIDVEGGLEDALMSTLAAGLDDDDEPIPLEKPREKPEQPIARVSEPPVVVGTAVSAEPPPEARATIPPDARATIPPEARATIPPEARATIPPSTIEHALPAPAPRAQTQDELKSWLGSEEAFFSSTPRPVTADTVPPASGDTARYAIAATLFIVAVILGVLLGRNL